MTVSAQLQGKDWILRLRAGLAALVLAAAGAADAQYFFRLDAPPAAPPVCNADSVYFYGPSTYSWNLPPPPNNIVYLGVVNGVHAPDYPDVQTMEPSSGTATEDVSHINPLGSPGVPYTVVVQGFPAIDGRPVGTGFQIRVHCDALGPGQGNATFSVVQAPALVAEFHNSILDHYFITADAVEAAAIDNGSAGPGWSRTGHTFNPGGSTPVCRFYGSMSPGPNSHFYTADAGECAQLKQLQAATPATEKRWNFESLDFVTTTPVGGACPNGTVPVYRAYNNGFARGVDSNHRITPDPAGIAQVVGRGWISEGIVMCGVANASGAAIARF